MPTIHSKVKTFQKKLCGTIKKEFESFDRKKPTEKSIKSKSKNKKEKDTVSCLFTTRSLSCRTDHLTNFYFTRRENQLALTCKDSQDNSHIKKRSTFYGSFFVTPSIKTDRVFVLAETNESFSQKALIHFSSLSSKISRAESMESVLRCGSNKINSSLSDTTDYLRKSTCGDKEKYCKVIPFDDSMGEIYTRRTIDSKASLNWLDIQAWYLTYLDDKLRDIDILEVSKSDTALDDITLHCPNKCHCFRKDMEIPF